MGKTVILSEQTVRDMMEAYASLAAWYYQLWAALRSGSATAEPPNDAERKAFLKRLAHDYPELSAVAANIGTPRPFLPPPPPAPSHSTPPPPLANRPSRPRARLGEGLPSPYADIEKSSDELATIVEPAPARRKEIQQAPDGIAPPPFVTPDKVKPNK